MPNVCSQVSSRLCAWPSGGACLTAETFEATWGVPCEETNATLLRFAEETSCGAQMGATASPSAWACRFAPPWCSSTM